MTRIARLVVASLVSLTVFGVSLAAGESASAAGAYTVSVAPAADTIPVGEIAVFRVRVEGQTASLPSFDFDVEGGTLAAVASIDPVAANIAEGAVFVTRDNEGTARLTVRNGSEVLATGQARFAMMGKVNVAVTLDAGPDAAARTWRFQVLSASGQVVTTLTANTSGDAATGSIATGALPYGFYTVRQVLGSDTATACAAGVHYAIAAPVSGETTVLLDAAVTTVSFSIAPCPDLPVAPGVSIPVDTIAPGPAGDGFLPGETPISEVRGTRQEGPGNPLPPSVGNTPPATASSSLNLFALLLVTCSAAMLLPAAAWSAATVRVHGKR